MSQMYFYSGDLDALLYLGLGIKVGEFAAEWVVSQMNNHVTNEWVMSQMHVRSGDSDALLFLGLMIKAGEFVAPDCEKV